MGVQPIVTRKKLQASSHLGTHSLPINVIANLVPVRVADADAKKMKLSVAAIATRGTTARTSNRIARSLTKVSADSFCTDLNMQLD